ncbi:hypothetical protein D3C73_917390 [compost metagenome]
MFHFFQPGAVIEVPGAAGLDVLRTELALLPAERRCHAEVIGAISETEAVADGTREFRAVLAHIGVVAGFAGQGVEQPFMVERRQALYLDGAAQGVGVHVRGQALDHRQRLHQFGRQHIQCHRATVAFRGGHQSAVDGHAVQVWRNAAHADETTFALITLH